MNVLDLAVLAVMATAVVGGYRLGLVAGGTSWVFLLQGLVLASLVAWVVLDVLGGQGPAVRLLFGTLLFFGAGLSAQNLGRRIGTIFRRTLVTEDWDHTDRVAGAVAAPVTVLAVVWLIVLPPMGQVVGWPANLARNSAIATGIRATLPDAPSSSRALRRLTGPVALPEVLTALGPAGDTSPPPTRPTLTPEVIERVSASTVKVEGEACLFDREGSGFAVAEDLVVTNAHVIAGGRKLAVVRPDGTRLPAVAAVFDTGRDLALLRVPNLGQEPLSLGPAQEGTSAAVFGHPDGQDEIEVSPATIRQQRWATVRSVDNAQVARRSVFVLAADLAPGDSGGALVTPTGTVAGVAFAIAAQRRGVAYALTTEELQPVLELDRTGTADTGPCF